MQEIDEKTNLTIPSKESHEFYQHIQGNLLVYQNLNSIVDKIHYDGILFYIKECFQKILSNEIEFTIKELKKVYKSD